MPGSFTSAIILKLYHETEQNYENAQSDAVRGGRDTSRVGIAVLQIDIILAAIDRTIRLNTAILVNYTCIRGPVEPQYEAKRVSCLQRP